MPNQNRPTLRLLVAAMALGFSQYAIAIASETQLAPVEVEASTPTQDDTVSHVELENRQARDLSDLYRGDAEISVGGGGNPITQKVYIRGVEESMLNMTIDGAYNNGKVYHHQSALIIDPQLIRQIEVEKGTAAASAGPGALGGAIRIQTVNASDLLQEGQSFGGNASLAGFSNEGWRSMASAYGRFGEHVDALISGSLLQTQNYTDGHGAEVAHSATEQQHLLAKVGVHLTPNQRINLSHQYSQDEGVRNTRANMVGFPHPAVPNEAIPQSFSRNTSTLNYSASALGIVDKAEATLYRNLVESDRTNGKRRNYGEEIDTVGFDLALSNVIGEHVLKYGFNWRDEESSARNIRNQFKNTGTGREDSQVVGGFVEGVLHLGAVQASAGLRYDDYSYTDNHRQEFNSDGFSPSVGLSWQVIDSLQLKAGHSRALRGVQMKEAFMLDIAQWKNAAQIDAEKAQNSEVGFEFKHSGVALSGNLYRQTIDNYVTSLMCGKVACRDNAGKATIDGYELNAEYRFGGFTTGLSVADSAPELDDRPMNDGDLGLGTSTGRTWITRASYAMPAQGLDFGWYGRFVESLTYTPVGAKVGDTRSKAGYGVHDVYVRWTPLKKDTLQINLTVKNLFDQYYYDQATYAWNGWQGKTLGYAEAGRDVRLEANLKF